MPHVRGTAEIIIYENGRHQVTTGDLVVDPRDKPRRLEDSGADVEVWREQIWKDRPGIYQTIVHGGAATAILVPTGAAARPDEHFLEQMADKSGELGQEALLGAVRTGAAAATQHCVDTCGGMWTGLDLMDQALAAMLKILCFKDDGWVRFVLPAMLSEHQGAFDKAQNQRWACARPGFQSRHEAGFEFAPVGKDLFDGESTLAVFGPLSDCQLIRVARVKLDGTGFRFRDGEWRTGKEGMEPLNRKIVAITTCANHPGVPRVLELHPAGHIRDGGLHPYLVGPNKDALLSHNPRRVLGPHGLGWLED